jgi:hypothetical protein
VVVGGPKIVEEEVSELCHFEPSTLGDYLGGDEEPIDGYPTWEMLASRRICPKSLTLLLVPLKYGAEILRNDPILVT